MIYVDDWYTPKQIGGYRPAIWCHLTVGPYDPIEELHAFARKIGMRREWFQGPPRDPWPRMHYDITKTRRADAVKAGAREITWREWGRQRTRARDAWKHAAADMAGTGLQEPRRDLPALVPGSLLWATAKAWYELTEARADLRQAIKEQGHPHGH